MAVLGIGALVIRQGQKGTVGQAADFYIHMASSCPAKKKKKKDKAGMRRQRKNKQGRKTTGREGYGYKTHFSISFSYKLQMRCTGVSKEANFLLSPQTVSTSLLAVTLLPPQSPQEGSQKGGCQSFGGALMRAQKSKSFETLPDWWPVSACESSERFCLIRLCIFEAFSVLQTNDQLQLIFNPLKGSRYSPVKTKYLASVPWGGVNFVSIDSLSTEHSEILASICELLARKRCQRLSFYCDLILAIKILGSQGK